MAILMPRSIWTATPAFDLRTNAEIVKLEGRGHVETVHCRDKAGNIERLRASGPSGVTALLSPCVVGR
jgi:hypothetical protein